MRKKISVLDYEVPVTILPLDEGGYLARCKALQGCMAEGETIEEVLGIVKDVAKNIIAILQEEHMGIPLKVIPDTTTYVHTLMPAFY